MDLRASRFSWCTLLAVVLLSGCGEVAPIGRRPASDQFLTQDRLATMAIPGASRDAIRRQFGEPYVLSQDGQAMAFLKQETAERKILTLAVVVPFWSKASVTYFQVQGIWFDAEGKVVKTKLWEGHDGPHGGNPYESYRVPTRQHVLLWLGQEAPASSK